jgi:hypothetical protein
VSFVTFNYDRSLEHFLFTSLKNTYGLTDDACGSMMMEHIAVVHLHGQLGHLPWQSRNGRSYNQYIDSRVVGLCVDGIKVVHEDVADGRDKEFERARKLIDDAKHIYFLGFGYGSKNIERLGIAHWKSNTAVGTALGLTEKEISEINQATDNKVFLVKHDCLGLLREQANLV